MTKQRQRRWFLRGLGGAVIAAPFLSTLGVRTATGQAAEIPKRVILYFTHYGCLTEKWFPANSHGALSASDFEGTTLAVLKDFAPKLLMPRGIRGMNEWSFAREFGQETDPHTQVMASCLTAAPVNRTSSGQTIGAPIDSVRFSPAPYGRSMDHVIAEQLNPAGVGPLVAHFGGPKTDAASTLSFSAPLEQYIGLGTANQMYAQLTSLDADLRMGMTEDSYAVMVRGKSAVDVVAEDLENLRLQRMSTSDHRKLDHWTELLHQATTQVRLGMCTGEQASALGIQEGSTPNDLPSQVQAMVDLAVMSALCDQTRITLLQMPGNVRMGFIEGVDSNTDNHGLSHRIGNSNMGGDCLVGVLDMLERIDLWYAQQFAYLLGRLDSIEEAEGVTLLDNSATVWLMEQSDGQAHNLNNLPILQAGSCGGYFKTGMAINVDDGSPTLTRGNSLGQCGQGDAEIGFAEVQDTGTANEFANAPMTKYICSLMNALGVKANAEGFAEVGGTEKVSKFGWSDDSSAFAAFIPNGGQGIADQPQGPFIDPGEFEELLA